MDRQAFPAPVTHKGIKNAQQELHVYCFPEAVALRETGGIFLSSTELISHSVVH